MRHLFCYDYEEVLKKLFTQLRKLPPPNLTFGQILGMNQAENFLMCIYVKGKTAYLLEQNALVHIVHAR